MAKNNNKTTQTPEEKEAIEKLQNASPEELEKMKNSSGHTYELMPDYFLDKLSELRGLDRTLDREKLIESNKSWEQINVTNSDDSAPGKTIEGADNVKNLGGMTLNTDESFDLEALEEKEKKNDEKAMLGLDELSTKETKLSTETKPAATDEQIDMSRKVVTKPAKFIGANPVKGIFQPVVDEYGQKRYYQEMQFQEQILVKRKGVFVVVDAKHRIESGYHLNVLPNKFAELELTPLPELVEEETKK